VKSTGEGGAGLSHVLSQGAVGSRLKAVMGVMSVKNVNVMDALGLSTSGGIASAFAAMSKRVEKRMLNERTYRRRRHR
jgi:hypothetical protein